MKVVDRIPPKPQLPALTITFEPEELMTLAIICCKVGGDPNETARGVASNLRDTLKDQGYDGLGLASDGFQVVSHNSSIVFQEGSKEIIREVVGAKPKPEGIF